MAEYIALDEIIEAEDSEGRYEVPLRWLLHCNKATYKTADVVERKRGKWEVISVANLDLAYGGRIYVPEFKCNQCGSYYESDVRWVEPIMPEDAHFPKFCPNCGADMRHPDD